MRRAVLTPTMRRVLENLAAGRRASFGLPGGRSFSGGFSGTMTALHRRGYIAADGRITDAGREALR